MVLALGAAVTPAAPGAAQLDVQPEDVAAIARTLNCPLCQGYNLQDCPLEVCAQMREVIRQQLAAGATPEQVVAAFVADYGPQVLNAPPRSGFFAAAWLVPVLALVAGAGLALATLLGAGRGTRPHAPAPATGVADLEQQAPDGPPVGADGPDPDPGRASTIERLERMARWDPEA